MSSATKREWKQGTDLPYILPVDGGMIAVRLKAAWLKADRSGQPLLLPPAVRVLDRLRALFETRTSPTPGFIIRLREAMELTQEQFAAKLDVSKMTVSRWECGRMRPSKVAVEKIRKLQHKAQREGVRISA